MTPKKKAEELVSRFVSINLSQVNHLVDGIRIRLAKESALIAVDEILIELSEWGEVWMKKRINYWQEVKQQIKNL